MTNKEMMRQLYERMAAEQQKYKAWLLEQPPNVILDMPANSPSEKTL